MWGLQSGGKITVVSGFGVGCCIRGSVVVSDTTDRGLRQVIFTHCYPGSSVHWRPGELFVVLVMRDVEL